MALSPDVPPTAGLLGYATSDGIVVVGCSHQVLEGDAVLGAVYGPVDVAEANWLVRHLIRVDDPGEGAPLAPWAAVVRRTDGSIAATASSLLVSGLFVAARPSQSQPGWVVATDPGQVFRSLDPSPALDTDYVAAYAQGKCDPWTTPYVGIARVPPGVTVIWRPEGEAGSRLGGAQKVEWAGPTSMPAATLDLEEALQLFVPAFDEIVARLADRAGSLVLAVSGGLDSTYLAASLARVATVDQPVHGFCASPLPEADLSWVNHRVADDLPDAMLLADRYPGIVEIHAMRNTDHVRPLVAAAEASQRSWLPTWAPANRVWLDQFQDQKVNYGARFGFVGTQGNASFSYSGQPTVPIAQRLRGSVRAHLRSGELAPRSLGRETYLAWLTGHLQGQAATQHPAAMQGLLSVDPFASRAILEIAAAIKPSAWRDGLTRAFARRAGAGRVPGEIRLRTKKGAQAIDQWHVIRNDKNDYLDRARALAGAPGLDSVDAAALANEVAAWPWGEAIGPPPPHLARVHRLLALADFSRSVAARRANRI